MNQHNFVNEILHQIDTELARLVADTGPSGVNKDMAVLQTVYDALASLKINEHYQLITESTQNLNINNRIKHNFKILNALYGPSTDKA